MLTKFKFNDQGTMNWFPGNTIVSNLYNNQDLMSAVKRIQEGYRDLPFAHKYSLTPEGSIHMTVFELLCHFNRKPEYWCNHLRLKETLENTDLYFYNQFSKINFISGFKMKPTGISSTNIVVNPIDEQVDQILRGFRNKLAEVSGLRFPNHDTYQFHISFGYRICELTNTEQQEVNSLVNNLNKEVISIMKPIPIDQIDFTVFEDMSEFVPYKQGAREQLRLKKGHEIK